MRSRRIFEATSWMPLVSLAIVSWYVKRFEGWSAWAAVPIFLPVIGFSAVMGSAGLVLWFREWRDGRRTFGLLMSALLAGSVSILFLAKGIFKELARSF